LSSIQSREEEERFSVVLDGDMMFGDRSVLMIQAETGVLYRFQAGGVRCEQVKIEGYVLDLYDFGREFDSCKYGCQYIGEIGNSEARERLFKDFKEYCKEYCGGFRFEIKPDWERRHEIIEGWIPVLVCGGYLDHDFKEGGEEGYVYIGNCD
jgi:hypothetical protein